MQPGWKGGAGMSLAQLNQQPLVQKMLRQSVRDQRVAHAYAFTGPGADMKVHATQLWYQAIGCLDQPGEGCDQCSHCRTIIQNNHPNWHLIEPDGASIKINQIRALQKQFQTRAYDGSKKMFVITHAEKMTDQAANSLLKWLEEPSSDILVILIVAQRSLLLPTIQSRVLEVRFLNEQPHDIQKFLRSQGLSTEQATLLSAITSSSDEAKNYISNEWFAEIQPKMIKWAQLICQHSIQAMQWYQEACAKSLDSSNVDVWLRMLAVWFRDMAYVSAGATERVAFRTQLDWMNRYAPKKPPSAWVQRMEEIQSMRNQLKINININNMMDEFAWSEGGIW